MQAQWSLQKQIMARYRELGIVGHLPAFGGYAPWALAVNFNQTRPGSGATRGICPNKDCDTAWIDGRDQLYSDVADAWMKQIIADFGTDHAWQMDAFCETHTRFSAPTCVSSPDTNCFSVGNGTGWGLEVVEEMPNAALGSDRTEQPESPLPPDPTFLARAKAAYGAVQRADGPEARWIYQGWALHVAGSGMNPPGPETLSRVQGFSSAAPPGKFILLDMAASGQWKDWKGTWGIPFIWTSLYVPPKLTVSLSHLYLHSQLLPVWE